MSSERKVTKRVRAELAGVPGVDEETLEVAAAGGTVRLSGAVESLEVAELAARSAVRVPGVGAVINELRVRSSCEPEAAGAS